MSGAPWIYSDELEPRVLNLLRELTAARSRQRALRGERPPALDEREEVDRVRALKDELRELIRAEAPPESDPRQSLGFDSK